MSHISSKQRSRLDAARYTTSTNYQRLPRLVNTDSSEKMELEPNLVSLNINVNRDVQRILNNGSEKLRKGFRANKSVTPLPANLKKRLARNNSKSVTRKRETSNESKLSEEAADIKKKMLLFQHHSLLDIITYNMDPSDYGM